MAEAVLAARPLLGQKLARALFCTPADSRQALTEVIKFLILAADYAAENSAGQLTPSARVDLAWHEFILFTRTYADFCNQNFGKLIHHEPSVDHEVNSRQYSNTLSRYRMRFGQPPAEYWGGVDAPVGKSGLSASCGSCEAGF